MINKLTDWLKSKLSNIKIFHQENIEEPTKEPEENKQVIFLSFYFDDTGDLRLSYDNIDTLKGMLKVAVSGHLQKMIADEIIISTGDTEFVRSSIEQINNSLGLQAEEEDRPIVTRGGSIFRDNNYED